jgi:hypothetical protein
MRRLSKDAEKVLTEIMKRLPNMYADCLSKRTLVEMALDLGYLYAVFHWKTLGKTIELTKLGRNLIQTYGAKRG